MKAKDVQIGATYMVKVAGNVVPVKIVRRNDRGGWDGCSVKTGKSIRIKSVQRLRRCAKPAATGATTAKQASKTAKSTKQRGTRQRVAKQGQRGAKAMSLLDAAAQLLSSSGGESMNCKQLVELAAERGLWKPRDGKTPAATLSAAIGREIANKGNDSRFQKADRGLYQFNAASNR